jgi:FtsP/CotA-like multicopper oxidase with cupredoxin domain
MEQKGTPYMDGVPMVTQCPISEYTTFRYDFTATRVGTLYWHSHIGKYITRTFSSHQKPK